MICVNELQNLKCNKRKILEPLTQIIAPYAPYITEELWHLLNHDQSIFTSSYPEFNERYLADNSFDYPISVNGKLRTRINFDLDMSNEEITREVLSSEIIKKWLEGKPPKKIIIVPKKIINIVV